MRARKPKAGESLPGSKREARMQAIVAYHPIWLKRLVAAHAAQRNPKPRHHLNPTGIKRALVHGDVRTPYFAKEMKRRRAARRVAHESRRVNR